MDKTTSFVVYWLHDDSCICFERHGYVGVSGCFTYRLSQWRRKHGKYLAPIPSNFKWKILLRGTEDECYDLEKKLRPDPLIGWNIKAGGRAGRRMMAEISKQKIRDKIIERGGIQNPIPKGTKRTATDRIAISAGTKAAAPMTPEQRQRQIANTPRGADHSCFGKPGRVTNPLLGKNQNGERNPFFGKTHSEAARQKVREALSRDVCINGHPKTPGKGCKVCNLIACSIYRARKRAEKLKTV